jgi:hypothetical protein
MTCMRYSNGVLVVVSPLLAAAWVSSSQEVGADRSRGVRWKHKVQ